MACETHCCVFSRGEFYISDWQSNCVGGLPGITCETIQKPFRKLGNISSALVEIQAEILGKENKYNPLVDTCARTLIGGVNITLSLNCASKENLYRALYGNKIDDDSGRHVKEFCVGDLEECDFFPFDKLQAFEEDLVITVHNPMGTILETLTIDTDYRFHKSGIEIARDISISGASTLRMAYDYDSEGFFEINFGSKFQGYKTVLFKGTNYDNADGELLDATFHKVLFAPVGQFDLISQSDFLTLTLAGSVEKSGSKWFKLIKQEG